MPITIETDNDLNLYALAKIISYARDNQYIFLAQSIGWIPSILGLSQGSVVHVNNLRAKLKARFQQIEELPSIRDVTCQAEMGEDLINNNQNDPAVSAMPQYIQEDNRPSVDLRCIHHDRVSRINKTHDDSNSEDITLHPERLSRVV